jgi:putative addiction module CopG family antidote
MNITLIPELEKFVREQVEAGNYADESAVVEAALLALRLDHLGIPDIPGGVPWTPETLRAAVQVGIDEADRGEFAEFDADDIMRRVHATLEQEQFEHARHRPDQKAG